MMERLHGEGRRVPLIGQRKRPDRSEVMSHQPHALPEAIKTRTRKLQHRVGKVDPNERCLRQRIENSLRHQPRPDPEIKNDALTDPRLTKQSKKDLLLVSPCREPLARTGVPLP